jgi:type IV secretion system protein TrbL
MQFTIDVKHKFRFIKVSSLIAGVTLCSLPNTAFAQNITDSVLSQFSSGMSAWYAPLQNYAQKIFWALVLLDFVWTIGKLFLSKADFHDTLAELAKQVVVIGLFWTFITHSAEWASAIVESFRMAGNTASAGGGGVQNLQPTDVFNSGVTICTTLLKTFSLSFDIGKTIEGIALVFAGFIVLISFCLIAALEVVALVESYVFIYAGVFFLGFGGHQITSDVAKRYLFCLIGVGAKLMIIQLVIGLGMKLIQEWTDLVVLSQGNLDLKLLIQIVGGSVVLLTLTKMVPELAQSMINGSSMSTANPLISSAMAAGSIASAVALGTAAGVATVTGNGAAAEKLGRAAVDQGGEAYRHTTGHHGANPLDRFQGGDAETKRNAQMGFRDSAFRLPEDQDRNTPAPWDPNPQGGANTIGAANN